ncbi:DCL family protein [Kordiimonas sp.]|uniref:DCL family protein n=1 Tax=Kordiimonas sp. TaxID=1970157 RepID=UPI003A93104A
MSIGSMHFEKKADALNFLKEMLNRYRPGEIVSEVDAGFLMDALDRHPDSTEKIGVGVGHFEVQSADYGTQCFCVVRVDKTREKFSYKSCI